MSGNGRKMHCLLRLRRHHWIKGIDRGNHIHKVCSDCGRSVLTHHASCSIHCALGGTGLPMPPEPTATRADIRRLEALIKGESA